MVSLPMNLMKPRHLFSAMAIIAFILFGFSMVMLVNSIENNNGFDPLELEAMTYDQIIQRAYESQNDISLTFILPIFGFFGVFIGALVYFLLFDTKTESVLQVKEESESKDYDSGISVSVFRRALSHDERKVFDLLYSRNGILMQSEISSMRGFNKVKAHRVVELLESKGIITKTNAGKQRVIRFINEFENLKTKKQHGFNNNSDGFTDE